jgi:hypothetical protein
LDEITQREGFPMNKHWTQLLLASMAVLAAAAMAQDEAAYRPFVLAAINATGLEQQAAATTAALEGAGFTVAGQYAPLDNTRVIVVTSPELQAVAAGSERGGYGAAQRISLTARDGKTEVAFVNPLYIQQAYRLGGDLQPVLDRLVGALGRVEEFGAKKGLSAKKLAKYHYMVGMQRFDDPSELGSFDNHEAAVAAVERGLARADDALTQVYRIDIPGTQQTLFGVGMRATGTAEDELDIDEAHQLAIVDFEGYSKVAYFPYEILVSGTKVEALHMRFRMAVHFPDLSMMGEHGFTKLMASPGATEDALEALLQAD